MPEGEVIDLTDLPDDPPAPAGLDPQQRAMAQHLLNVYPRDFLRDAFVRLLERQDVAIELAVYQALLASGGPAAVQGPAAYVGPPGIQLPLHAAYALNTAPVRNNQPGALLPVYPAHPGDHSEDEDEDEQVTEICTHCEEEFDPEDDNDLCWYHPGGLLPRTLCTLSTLTRVTQGI